MIGADTVAACITDGGADWTACETMVTQKFPWIYFLYCCGHLLSLILKEICNIDEVNKMFCFVLFFLFLF